MEFLRALDAMKTSVDPLPGYLFWVYVVVSGCLVLMAGLMSGLTLGLLSLDTVDMEVLKRSGSEHEKKCAERIMPVIKNEHYLLVTLVLCNAASTEALPVFLDRLVDPVTAVLLSVTVVLVVGEIIPQAVCSRHGLTVGASSAWFVRLLMAAAAPVAWPIGRLLDLVLGGEHAALFRRGQLKALVNLHSEHEGMGGTLSADEIAIITGALDLTSKTAWRAMTPLANVFMLSAAQVLDEDTLAAVFTSGHSRIPVHKDGDRRQLVGLLLVKELVLVDPEDRIQVSTMPLRPLPPLSADTPLYDMLKLFETGRSHMAVLTRPPQPAERAACGPLGRTEASGALSTAGSGQMTRSRSGYIISGDSAYFIAATQSGDIDSTHSEWGASGTQAGEPVGIITIEDCIEELLQAEIIDETDVWVDNQKTTGVDSHVAAQLPPRLARAISGGSFTPRVGRLLHTASAGPRAGLAAAAAAVAAEQSRGAGASRGDAAAEGTGLAGGTLGRSGSGASSGVGGASLAKGAAGASTASFGSWLSRGASLTSSDGHAAAALRPWLGDDSGSASPSSEVGALALDGQDSARSNEQCPPGQRVLVGKRRVTFAEEVRQPLMPPTPSSSSSNSMQRPPSS